MMAMVEYLQYAQRERDGKFALVDKVQDSYVRFVHMLEGFCNASTFRHLTEVRFDRKPSVIVPVHVAKHGYNPYFLSAGLLFIAAERLAGYPDGKKLGEHQLQWVLGANPRFMSFMNQLGVRNSGQYAASSSITAEYYPMAFYRHLRDMRWGVTTGIYGPLSKHGAAGSQGPVEYAQPLDYPNAGNSMAGRYNHVAQETWLNCNGWLLLLLAQLED
jgi:hypothetical protein